MAGFFEYSLRKKIRMIESLRMPGTKKVLITGGLARSQYLVDKVKAHFEGGDRPLQIDDAYHCSRSDRAVSLGGLFTWSEIESKDFSEDAAFGNPSEEVFEEGMSDHLDAEMNPKLVMDSEFDDLKIINHRWLPLVGRVSVIETYV